jgi:Flp pilus assembly protein TadD
MNSKSQRIEGWKSIAAYFRRDRTTVMRWAQHRGLPVHRLPGGGSSSVYAFADELDLWLARSPVDEHDDVEVSSEVTDQTTTVTASPLINAAAIKRKWLWASAAALGLVAVGAATLATRSTPPALSSQMSADLPADAAVAALYVEARANWALRTAAGLHKAVKGFGEVVSRDPQFAPGYAGLADAYLLIREFDAMPDGEAYAKAEAAAKASMAIDPGLADPHRALGFINYWWHHDTRTAAANFTRALQLDPKNAQTHFWLGNCLMDNGEITGGLDHLNKARLLNPESDAIKTDYAFALWLKGDHDASKAILEAQAKAHPDSVGPRTYLGYIRMIEGDWPGYLTESELRADNRDDPRMKQQQLELRNIYARGGKAALIRELMKRAAADRATGNSESSNRLANWAAATGHRAELVEILSDSDARKQSWGMGGFADLAIAGNPNDAPFAKLVSRRKSEAMIVR